MSDDLNTASGGLKPYLSKTAVWAFAVGTAVGWGLLMNNEYLMKAGPVGTILGLILGMGLMMLVSRFFSYMDVRFPNAGGIYGYTKHVFGYDRAYIVAWFTALTYLSMLWANATALPLFFRNFIGDGTFFKFGYLYTLFGKEVYLGEALLSMAAIALVALMCIKSKKVTSMVMVILVFIFVAGIAVCFIGSLIGRAGGEAQTMAPGFIEGKSGFTQVMNIMLVSPWAYIGFESVTHSSTEFNFPRKKLFAIMIISVVVITILYMAANLLSVTAFPTRYANWWEYISDLDNCEGIEGIPAFYAVWKYMGNGGVVILAISLLALVITSLIANIRVVARLAYSLAHDEILPRSLTVLNKKHIPYRTVMLVAGISMLVPFIGRMAVVWIVDVTTIGATILYAFIAACSYKTARTHGDKGVAFVSAFGLIFLPIFSFFLLAPNLFGAEPLQQETYIVMIAWSILGLFLFGLVIRKEHARRFGKALIVWIGFLVFIVTLTLIWSSRMEESVMNAEIDAIKNYYSSSGVEIPAGEAEFIAKAKADIYWASLKGTLINVGLFALSLIGILSNHFMMKRWERKTASERDAARDIAYRDSMTGVKSKTAFLDAETDIDEKIAGAEVKPFGVVVCDLNGLKHINDTLGHKAGDRYICDACNLVCEYFKHSPVYRVGGDEFCVILQGADYENREEIINRLNEVIESHIGTERVVLSIGESDYNESTDLNFHDVFSRADGLMYERKMQLKAMGAKTRE